MRRSEVSPLARSGNQKLKLLYLLRYLERNSDEEHPVRVSDMVAELGRQGISAERKSIYSDIEALRTFGVDIMKAGGGYWMASRRFELPELKLLVDSVQASRFITRRKSSELISKLESLASAGQARQLQRQVYVLNRVKTMNESIYYNVDGIHTAIAGDRRISFRYFDYAYDRTKVYRREGKAYEVSPYALSWAEDNYYLLAYDGVNRELRHYRVDKMDRLRVLRQTREGAELFHKEDIGRYTSRVFGMFRGAEKQLRLRFRRHLAGAVMDRFGQELILVPEGEDSFTCTVTVAVSPQFYGWLCGFGSEAAILAPGEEAEAFRAYLRRILEAQTAEKKEE